MEIYVVYQNDCDSFGTDEVVKAAFLYENDAQDFCDQHIRDSYYYIPVNLEDHLNLECSNLLFVFVMTREGEVIYMAVHNPLSMIAMKLDKKYKVLYDLEGYNFELSNENFYFNSSRLYYVDDTSSASSYYLKCIITALSRRDAIATANDHRLKLIQDNTWPD